ncbi:MAG: hypothetical protein JWL97_1324 [Gemmatimonadales bacterium]|nr:hypothetical protein [Gemmatimonadales bacterium]
MIEDELVQAQPGLPLPEGPSNGSVNAKPPLRVNSRNVPRRSSLGLPYCPRAIGGPRFSFLLTCMLPPWKESGRLPDKVRPKVAAFLLEVIRDDRRFIRH